jgi:hypothetical protein
MACTTTRNKNVFPCLSNRNAHTPQADSQRNVLFQVKISFLVLQLCGAVALSLCYWAGIVHVGHLHDIEQANAVRHNRVCVGGIPQPNNDHDNTWTRQHDDSLPPIDEPQY